MSQVRGRGIVTAEEAEVAEEGKVSKMRGILGRIRKCEYDQVKGGAQAIYLRQSGVQAEATLRRTVPIGEIVIRGC